MMRADPAHSLVGKTAKERVNWSKHVTSAAIGEAQRAMRAQKKAASPALAWGEAGVPGRIDPSTLSCSIGTVFGALATGLTM